VLSREVCLAAAHARNTVDPIFLNRGLHSNPDLLREDVQAAIDAADEGQYEAVVLAYGLCSNGTAGLRAGSIPLVVPRAHDCITLLVGSKEEYARLFGDRPGTYYYTGGWIERQCDSVPLRQEDGEGLFLAFEVLVEKYGRDNAEYLWELQSNWADKYTHATHIDTDLGPTDGYRVFVKDLAAERGWDFDEIPGDLSLLQAMLDGEWDDERFLTVHPGQQIVAAPGHPDVILTAEPMSLTSEA
jgi:hypothetical protein